MRFENKKNKNRLERKGIQRQSIFNRTLCFSLRVVTAGKDIVSSVLRKKLSSLSRIRCSCPDWNCENMLIHTRKACNCSLFLTRDWRLALRPALSTYHNVSRLHCEGMCSFYSALAEKRWNFNSECMLILNIIFAAPVAHIFFQEYLFTAAWWELRWQVWHVAFLVLFTRLAWIKRIDSTPFPTL